MFFHLERLEKAKRIGLESALGGNAPSLAVVVNEVEIPDAVGMLSEDQQEGQHVFKYAVRRMADVSVHVLEKLGLRGEHVDLFVPHQANVRIIDAAQHRLGLPDEKVVKNIDRYGNTTAATIPLALGTALDERRLKHGDLVVLAAVGAGFTVGAAALRWHGFPWP